MTLSSSSRSINLPSRQGWIAFLVVCIVLAVGFSTSQWLMGRERLALSNYLSHELEVAHTRLGDAFERYTGLMVSVRGWLYVHDLDSWEDAQAFSKSLELKERYPALSGMGFVRRVKAADVPDWLARVRQRGLSTAVTIRPIRPMFDQSRDHYLADWVVPAGQERSIGMELSSDPIRWEAMKLAAITGSPAVTAPLRLTNAHQPEYGLLLLLPVYEGGVTPAGREARLNALQGFIALGLPAKQLAKEAGLLDADRYDWHWLDPQASRVHADTPPGQALPDLASEADQGVELVDSDQHRVGSKITDIKHWQANATSAAHQSIMLGQRQYSLFVRSTKILEREWEPLAALFVGVGSMPLALLAGWAAMAAFRLRRAETDRISLLQRDVERLSLVAQHTHNGIVMCDREGRIVWTNDARQQITGYSADEMNGQVFAELLQTGNTDPAARQRLELAILEGKPYTVDLLSRDKAGREYWIALELIPLRDANQACTGFMAVEVDITERIQTQERLQAALYESEGLMNAVRTHAIVSQTTPEGVILDVNDAFCVISGYQRAELLGRTHQLVRSGVHDEVFWRNFWGTISRGKAWRGQVANRSKTGEIYWVDSIVSPLMGADGQIERYISIRFDITARKRSEVALRASKQRLDNILRATDAGTWILDVEQGEVEVDDRWLRMLGRPEEAGIRLGLATFLDHVHPDDKASVMLVLHAHIQGDNDSFEYTHRMRHINGEWLWVRTRGQAFARDKDGRAQTIYGINLDVNSLKVSEEQAEEARQLAEDANRAKSQFLANMSHEIRTPMNAVLGMLQLMLGTPLDARQQDYATKAEAAAQSLLGIINDILDFSKIEAGKLELDPNPFNLASLIDELRTIFEANLRGKRLELRYDIDPGIPPVLVGDSLRLQQILINLGGNAIKFTPAGSVTLQVQRLSQSTDADGQQHVRLKWSVIDTGIGISAEAQERLFTAFSQAESSTTRRFGGTGLGLAISQRLAGLMGGQLQLQSAAGVGSTFAFEIELPVSTEKIEATQTRADVTGSIQRLTGMRVLVVEDNPINQQVAHGLLTREGAAVVLADHGQAALDRLEAGPSDFDVVLMDMQMPVMDGLQATQAIRQRLHLTQLPIIAMTANVMEQDRKACMEAGMNDHVGKPFAIDELVAVLLQWVPHFEPGEVSLTQEAPFTPDPMVNLDQGMADWPDADRIDVKGALSRLGGDPVLYAKLLESFAQSLPQSVQDLTALQTQPVNKALAALLHTIKGTAATVGAIRLAAVAAEAERVAKAVLADTGEAPAPGWLGPIQQECVNTSDAVQRVVDAMGHKGLLPQEAGAAEWAQNQADPALWLNQLQQLLALLANSDMDALNVHDQLLANPAIQRDPRWADLHQAMTALDFEAAFKATNMLMSSC